MQESDLVIVHRAGVYAVRVSGRANFEYAVPIRELINTLGDRVEDFRFDMSGCLAMDSTFMGVLSMIGLKARRAGTRVELVNASDFVKKLLRDLGVNKLFAFTDAENTPSLDGEVVESSGAPHDMLAAAETVSEAHEKLVEADQSNAARFGAVIEFAHRDVERLRREKEQDEDAGGSK
ncbi:MAG: STAS domain-containing protein [Victivallaceae bacterium]|nr:STAS domain-containing protein [Victivallaceae bacterium]